MRSVIVWALAATTGGGCLLIDDLSVGPTADTPAGGAPATTTSTGTAMVGSMASTMTTGSTTSTTSSVGSSTTSSTATTGSASSGGASTSTGSDSSSSTGCTTPPGDPAMCEGGAPNMSCTLSENCACKDCWGDGANCPASFCNHNGSCDPVSETCLCCDCADKPACNP